MQIGVIADQHAHYNRQRETRFRSAAAAKRQHHRAQDHQRCHQGNNGKCRGRQIFPENLVQEAAQIGHALGMLSGGRMGHAAVLQQRQRIIQSGLPSDECSRDTKEAGAGQGEATQWFPLPPEHQRQQHGQNKLRLECGQRQPASRTEVASRAEIRIGGCEQ